MGLLMPARFFPSTSPPSPSSAPPPALSVPRALRLDLRMWTEGRADGKLEFHTCRNISVTGMYIETKTPYPVGKEVQVEFCLPGTLDPITTQAEVVTLSPRGMSRLQPPGNGLRFLNLSPRGAATLRRFITSHLEGGDWSSSPAPVSPQPPEVAE